MVVDKVPTPQELYDRIERDYDLGKFPCLSKKQDGACAYRGDNENGCFIGLTIPDEVYDELSPDDWENVSMDSMGEDEAAKLIPEWMSHSQACELQQIHDISLRKMSRQTILSQVRSILKLPPLSM